MAQILSSRRDLYTDLVQTIADLKSHADSAAATLNWKGATKLPAAYTEEVQSYLRLLQAQQTALIDLLLAQGKDEPAPRLPSWSGVVDGKRISFGEAN